MAAIKPQPWPAAKKCRRCRGRGALATQSRMSGVPYGPYHHKSCPRCFGAGWRGTP